MALIISKAVETKIGGDDHGNVSRKDVEECFNNHCGLYCHEHHAEHFNANGLPSLWFVAETNHRRVLKIMFIKDGADIHLKSAYPASQKVQEIFYRKAK